MRNPGQVVPDHAARLDTLNRSVAGIPDAAIPGTVVRLSGTARPGPAGVLTAPLSGRPCIWYRAVQFHFRKYGPLEWQAFPPRPEVPLQLGSDIGYAHGDSRTDDESAAPFLLETASGPVLVDPVRADVRAATVSVHATEGEYRFTPYIVRHEWIIEAGTPLFALGPIDVSSTPPVVRADPRSCAVVDVGGEQAAVSRSQSFLAAGGATPLGGARLPSPAVIAAVVAVTVVMLAVLGVVVVLAAG